MCTKGAELSLCNNNFTADDISNYFLSVPYNTVQSISSISVSPLSYLHDTCDTTFQISAVDLDDTVSVLSNVDSAKATGCDGLPVKFLKACPLAVGRLLTIRVFHLIVFLTFGNMLLSH